MDTVKAITITIPEALDERAVAEARRRGISKSELIRQGLDAVLPSPVADHDTEVWRSLAGFGSDALSVAPMRSTKSSTAGEVRRHRLVDRVDIAGRCPPRHRSRCSPRSDGPNRSSRPTSSSANRGRFSVARTAIALRLSFSSDRDARGRRSAAGSPRHRRPRGGSVGVAPKARERSYSFVDATSFG